MRGLAGRAEALAGKFNAQDVASTLWAACVFYSQCATQEASRWVDVIRVVMQQLVCLGEEPERLNTVDLRQLHQFFVSCSLEEHLAALSVQARSDMRALQDACRCAFVGVMADPSVTQLEVSETLRRMGLSVQDEFRCPTSGYTIDMLVHDCALAVQDAKNSSACMAKEACLSGEKGSRGGGLAVEFDGPQHFLASRAPTGGTLLKRRHLQAQIFKSALCSAFMYEMC